MAAEGPQRAVARLALIGDVMLGRLVSREIPSRRPESFWGDVRNLLRSCDAVIANLECALTENRTEWRLPKAFHFGAVPSAVEVLKAGNVRAVSLANNHVLDFEIAGLFETLRVLDAAGIAHAGAGTDKAAAQKPALFAAGDIRIALFACVDHEPSFAASTDRGGTSFVNIEQSDAAFPTAHAISDARAIGADIVILSTHFGPNMVTKPTGEIVNYRRNAASRGADIVFGHSAHLFQGIERYERSLILHDAGDFLDDYAVDQELRNDWSFAYLIEIDENGLRTLELHPVILEFARVRLATEEEADPLFERMTALSSDFGTELKRDGNRLTLDLRA